VIGIAAALAAAAFLLGYAVADRRTAFDASKTLTMHGVGPTAAARGTIQIGSHDSGGNYPIQMTVTGLRKLPEGGWYELLLSKRGRPTLSCGAFAVDHTRTTVRLSVPYDLSERPRLFDGWVVTRHLPKQRPSPVVMTT
jgi:hypothetical protein